MGRSQLVLCIIEDYNKDLGGGLQLGDGFRHLILFFTNVIALSKETVFIVPFANTSEITSCLVNYIPFSSVEFVV